MMKSTQQIFALTVALLTTVSCTSNQSERSDLPPGYNPNAVTVNSIAPDRGLADSHTLYVDGRLYAMCGHDRDWDIVTSCQMDRWEMWSTSNLKDWRYELAIDSSETYIGDEDNCWAGDLAVKDGVYYWYFSNRNYSTGVMSAPSITGPWRDALGEPLLPTGIVKGKPYDPEIYEEDGVYSIIFGAGQYWIATLGDDMISLKDKPVKMTVVDDDGNRVGTGDKPCIFKRNGWFYLMWGNRYAMSRELRGTYVFKGDFLDGGHGTVFQWTDGQWYSLQEQHETNAFYRGIQLRPLYFNADDTVYIPEQNWEYPLPGRDYNFTHSRQGWRCEDGGTSVNWVEDKSTKERSYITGEVDRVGAIVTSVPFLHTPLFACRDLDITVDNVSGAKVMRVAINGYSKDLKPYTRKAPQKVDWSAEEWIEVPLVKGLQTINIPLDRFTTRQDYMHQLAVQPAADVASGRWILENVQLNPTVKIY